MSEYDKDAGWIYLIKVNDVYKVGKTTDWKARLWDYVDVSKLNVVPLRLTRDIDRLTEHEREIQEIIYPHVNRVKSLERGRIAKMDTSEWFRLKDIDEAGLIELFEAFQRKVFEEAGWTTPEYHYQLKCVRLWKEKKCGHACNALCGGGAWDCRLYHEAQLERLYAHKERLEAGEYFIDKRDGKGATEDAVIQTRRRIQEHKRWLKTNDRLSSPDNV